MKKIITVLFVMVLIFSTSGSILKIKNCQSKENIVSAEETEYWALLVGCNEFDVLPILNLGGNDRVVNEIKSLLLASDNWQEDHIKILTGKNATKRNIIDGFRWLDKMDDEDDICFFYISSHGDLGRDIFPKDEDDSWDEYILTYDSYRVVPILGWSTFPWTQIRDDRLNMLLNRLDSKGVFVIIETCFSGGFNDPPLSTLFYQKDNTITLKSWMNEFAEEISAPGRVILMSGEEESITQGLCFTYFAMEGMQGGDANNDQICSAEEIFNYASPLTTTWLRLYKNWDQHPQIYDDYPGELPITIQNLPPDQPEDPIGTQIGTINTEYNYILRAFDPEDDRLRYHINWDDNNKDITDLVESGESVNVSHIWLDDGTYNIWLETEDEYNAMKYQFGLPKNFQVIICDNDNKVDQYQTKIYQPQGFYDCMIMMYHQHWTCMQAQSFKPTYDTLTKVDLWIGEIDDNSYPLKVAIRKNLSGEDLTYVYNTIPMNDLGVNTGEKWTTFDFPDISVTPGDTYYIVCSRTERSIATGAWFYGDPDYLAYPHHDEDPYPDGEAYKSEDGGVTWVTHDIFADDFCFVTYGKNLE